MKRKSIMAIVLCVLLCAAFSVVAFAGDYDTPVIPIHTKHSYYILSTTQPTCEAAGERTYKCRQCTSTYTEEYLSALGHKFSCNNLQSGEGIELKCRYCDETQTYSASQLEEMWDVSYINSEPQRSATDESAYLDLDGNNIINAKDFAMIINME